MMGSEKEEIGAEAYLFIEVANRAYKYRIRNTVTTIGSAEDNMVRIKEPSVEEHHLLISYVAGQFYLRRLGDAPARINGERVEAFTEELRYGDEIGIGDVILRLAEGRSTSDVAIALSVWTKEGEEGPWLFYVTKKSEFKVGDMPADLVLPGAGGVNFENFGSSAQYLVPSEGTRVRLNEEVVERRKRLRDKDVISIPGYGMRVRFLRAEILEDPEAILGADALRRFGMEVRR